jgi:hypothetical protein
VIGVVSLAAALAPTDGHISSRTVAPPPVAPGSTPPQAPGGLTGNVPGQGS